MSTDRPAKSLYPPRRATAVKKGDVLQAEASHALNPDKKIKLQTYRRPVWDPYLNRWVPEWDPYLLRWFGTATEDETVEVVVHLDNDARPFLLEMRNHPEEDLDDLQEQETRSTAVNENGGFVNPYTFVPTPPRGDLAASGGTPEGAGSAGSASDDTDGPDAQGQHFPGAGAFDGTDPVPGPATGLADSGRTGPPSHALHGPEQWSGRLTLRLTARTPLLMPDQQRAQKDPQCPDRSVVATRTDPRTGRPLLPGTSVKGTLRSAFETVTASRFGVFGGHDLPLAYRTPARTGSELVPAVVVSREGRDYFQLCRGDEDWHPGHPEATEPEVQFAAWVPAYAEGGDPPRVVLAGGLRKAPSKRWSLKELHATVVHARVRLYRLSASDQPGSGMCRVWVVTHLADTPDSLAEPRSEYEDPKELGKSLYLVPDTEPRIVRGVLSASGRSIGRKEYERLFVTTPEDVLVPVTGEHRRFWVSVIEAYDEASRYHDPVKPLERSWHVGQADAIKGLPSDATEGFGKILPVYVGGPNGRRLGSGVVPGSPEAKGGTAPTILEAGEVTQVHPVMIGRLPFEASPADLL
ncbi:MAG: hypothetical protein QG608_3228, partial [Actinomycetota bacterium]|nr:hypothetical protein [Actinomycetota bacterium]